MRGRKHLEALPSPISLRPGMILSNEPGYYKPGAYGIRIENLVAVAQAERQRAASRSCSGSRRLHSRRSTSL